MDIVGHYSKLLAQHGDDPKAVQIADRTTQRRRFAVTRRLVTVIAMGCSMWLSLPTCTNTWSNRVGTASTRASTLRLISSLDAVTSSPVLVFTVWDISAGLAPWQADWRLLTGCSTIPDPWGFLTVSLRHMLALACIGITFNLMSTYVDRLSPELVYFDPEAVFHFCKEELSRW